MNIFNKSKYIVISVKRDHEYLPVCTILEFFLENRKVNKVGTADDGTACPYSCSYAESGPLAQSWSERFHYSNISRTSIRISDI